MLPLTIYVRKPKLFLIALLKKLGFLFSESTYLKMMFFLKTGHNLDLRNPKSFNEKIQWLKLNDRKVEYTDLVDKIKVKQIVSEKLNSDIIIPTLGVWSRFEDIDFASLPDSFVLKTNHSGGSTGVIVCRDKNLLDKHNTKLLLERSLKSDIYKSLKEWPYKNVDKKIFAEKLIGDGNSDLNDYKLMCFNGKVLCSFVCLDRKSSSGMKINFYDRDWVKLPFQRSYPSSSTIVPKPMYYDKMIEYAEILSKNMRFARIDFYEVENKLYFGEVTFYPGSGFETFTPELWDYTLGSWLKL